MQEYLVFQLAGTMASWGDIAIGENRPTHRGPTRSAVLGLVAGALGFRRTDASDLAALQEHVGVSALTLADGSVMRDYHTSQVPPASAVKGRVGLTRREELLELVRHNRQNGTSAGTILSTREYLCDAAWLVALWCRDGSQVSLLEIRQALECPKFVPYLGRKSCPVALPLGARLLAAESIREALRRWWSDRPELSIGLFLPENAPTRPYRLEWDLDGQADVRERSRSTRRDAPGERARWQFINRPVCEGDCTLEDAT